MNTDMFAYYGQGQEADRLKHGMFRLERARTEELITRYLPVPPAAIIDIGGGAGAYALWLAEKGYAVHLIDPVPLHVELAAKAAGALREPGRLTVEEGDARRLNREDASCDAALLLGPLYHLTEAGQRAEALREVHRILRPGGTVIAAAISRFASLLDGLRGPLFDDPVFRAIVAADLHDGQHRNERGKFEYFTTAYFHQPTDFLSEVEQAGFAEAALYAVEGPAAWISDFVSRWEDEKSRKEILWIARTVECEPSIIGVSPHILCVARRQ